MPAPMCGGVDRSQAYSSGAGCGSVKVPCVEPKNAESSYPSITWDTLTGPPTKRTNECPSGTQSTGRETNPWLQSVQDKACWSVLSVVDIDVENFTRAPVAVEVRTFDSSAMETQM